MKKVIFFFMIITFSVETHNDYNTDYLKDKKIKNREIIIQSVSDYYGQDYDLIKFIFDISGNFDIDPLLVTSLIKIESDFKENAVSKKNAIGYCQITRIANIDVDEKLNRYNKHDNILLGVMFLSKIIKRFDNDINKSLAYYNVGNEHINNTSGARYARAVQREYKRLKDIVL